KKGRKSPREYDRELYKARHLDRKLLRPAQAVPCHRHPLRQDREKLPRRHSPGRQPHLAQLMTGPNFLRPFIPAEAAPSRMNGEEAAECKLFVRGARQIHSRSSPEGG